MTPDDIRMAYSNQQMTYTEAYTALEGQGWSNNDIEEFLAFPPGTYVQPIGPEQTYGDFDNDGIPNRFDPDHYDTDGDGVPEFYDPEEGWVWPGKTYPSGVENGGKGNVLDIAGWWVIGVAQGTLMALIPITMVALSVGFMRRVVKMGADVGES